MHGSNLTAQQLGLAQQGSCCLRAPPPAVRMLTSMLCGRQARGLLQLVARSATNSTARLDNSAVCLAAAQQQLTPALLTQPALGRLVTPVLSTKTQGMAAIAAADTSGSTRSRTSRRTRANPTVSAPTSPPEAAVQQRGAAPDPPASSSSSTTVHEAAARSRRSQSRASSAAGVPPGASAAAASAQQAARQPSPTPRSRKTGSSTSSSGTSRSSSRDPTSDPWSLAQQLQEYCVAYYQGNPLVPDDVYDSELARFAGLVNSLKASGVAGARELEENSPLKKVGATLPVSSLRKVTHPTPMTSLAAVKDKAAVTAWGSRLAKLGVVNPEAVDWVVEPKVDGLAVRIVYRQGRLLLAATRGNGSEGEDVTHNVTAKGAVQGLPVHVPTAVEGRALPAEFEVRGEVYITTDDFAKLNAQQLSGAQFANPRNAAAGSLRLLNPQEAASRHLSFLAYQLVVPDDKVAMMPRSHLEGLQLLGKLGFATTASVTAKALKQQARFEGLSAAVKAAEQWMAQRGDVGFQVDGAVLKVDDLQQQATLGTDGAKDPRWAVAWKFPSKAATTRVLGIEWSMGRTGVLTPVVKLEPVQLAGVNIQNVSLHSAGHQREMQLGAGDVVWVERAGDVIPQIVGVVTESRTHGSHRPFQEPSKCPSCSSTLQFCEPVTAEAKGTLRCNNALCPEQQLARQVHFVNVALKGIGPSTTEHLWKRGWLNTPAGLYSLREEDVLTLPGFGPKKAANALAAIDKSRHMGLATLLCALGIEMIGKQQASHLAARYKTMKHLQLAINSYDLSFSSSSMGIRGSSSSSKGGSSSSGKGGSSSSSSGVAGGAASLDPFFTTEAGKSLRAWFSSSDNKLLLNQLRQAGIRCCQEDPEAAAAVALPGDKSSSSSTGGGSRGSSSLPQAKPVLQGLTICITGPIAASQFANREQVADFVTELGGQFKNSMTRTTSWLVVGSGETGKKPPQGKLSKAVQWGVRVLSEEELFAEVQRRQREG